MFLKSCLAKFQLNKFMFGKLASILC